MLRWLQFCMSQEGTHCRPFAPIVVLRCGHDLVGDVLEELEVKSIFTKRRHQNFHNHRIAAVTSSQHYCQARLHSLHQADLLRVRMDNHCQLGDEDVWHVGSTLHDVEHEDMHVKIQMLHLGFLARVFICWYHVKKDRKLKHCRDVCDHSAVTPNIAPENVHNVSRQHDRSEVIHFRRLNLSCPGDVESAECAGNRKRIGASRRICRRPVLSAQSRTGHLQQETVCITISVARAR
mmetsp:Transcript_96235/g.170898  ORF Transcript_96235/g.170898 Transcript_96235/m.170898 type:complete len:235 (+) Transcript_96235:619-1323(+)